MPPMAPPATSGRYSRPLMMVAVVWFAARFIGLARPSRGPTGNAWLDAEGAFDRVRRQQQRHHLAAVLRGQPHGLDLPVMNGATTLGGLRNPTEVHIPIRDIAGTAGAGDGKFDRDFLPTDERSRWRFQALVVAVRQGEALPPIEAYRLHGRYWVADGHHRIAVARALGEDSIVAYVTQVT